MNKFESGGGLPPGVEDEGSEKKISAKLAEREADIRDRLAHDPDILESAIDAARSGKNDILKAADALRAGSLDHPEGLDADNVRDIYHQYYEGWTADELENLAEELEKMLGRVESENR